MPETAPDLKHISSPDGPSHPAPAAGLEGQLPSDTHQDLRTILNSLREAVLTIDGEDRIRMFNPATSRVFGIPEGHLAGLPVAQLYVDGPSAARFKATQMATLKCDRTVEDEIPMRRGDGEIFTAEITMVPLGEMNGLKNGYILVARDIDHRKRNQAQVLRRTHQMAILNEIGGLLNRSLARDDVLPLTLQRLRHCLHCDTATFYTAEGSDQPDEIVLYPGLPGNTDTSAVDAPPEVPGRQGPIWRAARTRQVIFVEHSPGHSVQVEVENGGPHLGSTASIPILSHGQLLGVLTLGREKQRPFSGEDVDLFLPLAQMMATAVENIRLVAGLKNLNEQLLTLHELSVRLAQNNTEESVLRETLESLSHILGCRIAIYREPDAHGKALLPYSFFGLDNGSSLPGSEAPPAVSLLESSSPRPLTATAFLSVGRSPASAPLGHFPDSPWRKRLQAMGIRFLMAAPVLVRDKPLGVATFYFAGRPGLTSNERRLLQVGLRQAGAALANARLFKDLQTNRRILARLSSRILTAQEEERRHLSRELHDGIGQSLSALKLGLEMLGGDHPARNASLHNDLPQALEIVTETIAELRRISQDLRPPILDDLGLLPTLRWLATRFQSQTGLDVRVEVEGKEHTLSPQQDVNLYRIAQESLTNVAKHAEATAVQMQICWGRDRVRLRITDDGSGFQPALSDSGVHGGGLGMASIKERANLMGGRFKVESQASQGTALEVEIPFHPHSRERSQQDQDLFGKLP